MKKNYRIVHFHVRHYDSCQRQTRLLLACPKKPKVGIRRAKFKMFLLEMQYFFLFIKECYKISYEIM